MRPVSEVQGMRDNLHRQLLAGAGKVEPYLGTLDWACDPLVSDRELLDQIEPVDEADELRIDDALSALADFTDAGNIETAKLHLQRSPSEYLTDLAKAARRIDRLCKAELKERNK